MNSYSVLWFLVLIHSFSNIMAQSGSGKGNSQLFLGQYPIPKKTSAPINIETDKVKNAQLSPLIFTAVLGANAKVINNGFSVEAILDQATPGATVRGGPLRNDIYIFHVTEYFWAGNSSGPAGTLINGTDGVPIEAVAFWYNQKYGSFDNSKNYRDGMAAIAFPVKIDPLPNLAFIPFSEKVEKVRKPGSNVTTNLAETFIWFDGYIIPNTPYFSYPGSYRDQKHSKEYYCATVIIFRPQINFISEKQFENSFLKLKDSKGNQLINAVPPQPQGDIPVIQAEGQLQIFFPVGKQLLDVSKY